MLAFCDLSACGQGGAVAPLPSFLLVTLDTTRVDHISCYGYERDITPNLNRLLRESVCFTRAWFLFVNYFDPHFPYTTPDEFGVFPGSRSRFQPPIAVLLHGERELSENERRALVGRYDAEIRYVDHHLGCLLDAAHARDEVALTVDHGEAFGEGGLHQSNYWLSDELLRVPLLIRYPDGRGAGTLDDAPVQLVNVLPLVAYELGLEIPHPLDGIAPGHRETAFADLYRGPTAVVRHGDRFDLEVVVAISWPHKLVKSVRGDGNLVRLHEDLREEPIQDETAFKRLGSALDERDRTPREAAAQSRTVDPEIVEVLRRLGYVV